MLCRYHSVSTSCSYNINFNKAKNINKILFTVIIHKQWRKVFLCTSPGILVFAVDISLNYCISSYDLKASPARDLQQVFSNCYLLSHDIIHFARRITFTAFRVNSINRPLTAVLIFIFSASIAVDRLFLFLLFIVLLTKVVFAWH